MYEQIEKRYKKNQGVYLSIMVIRGETKPAAVPAATRSDVHLHGRLLVFQSRSLQDKAFDVMTPELGSRLGRAPLPVES